MRFFVVFLSAILIGYTYETQSFYGFIAMYLIASLALWFAIIILHGAWLYKGFDRLCLVIVVKNQEFVKDQAIPTKELLINIATLSLPLVMLLIYCGMDLLATIAIVWFAVTGFFAYNLAKAYKLIQRFQE